MRRTPRAAGQALACAGLALIAACGMSGWRDASARLHAASADARAAGYEPLAGPYNDFGVFSAAGSATTRVTLAAGGDYFIAAACTGGCDSLDFDVAGPGGTALASDTGRGAAPRLAVRPAAGGEHALTVRFGACRERRCRWVAQVYRRAE